MKVDDRSDESVYAAHAAELVRFATAVVGVADAPDVVADAFLRVAATPTWAVARDKRALWLRTIVFEARSWHRSAGRRRAREQRVAAQESTRSENGTVLADERIAHALDQLSTQQRAVVVLTYWMDLEPSAIADLLGVADGTVRKQLARARARLREELA